MRFVAVRDAALKQLNRFKTTGSLGTGERLKLIPAAVNGETNRLTDEFVQSHALDNRDGDQAPESGRIVTSRGPTPKESLPRHLDTEVLIKGDLKNGESERHEIATAYDDKEPYQETFEYTKYRDGGISHVSVVIQGDAVGTGGIITMAQFLSPEPGESWRERSFESFTGGDILKLYDQGTYKPQI